MRLVRAWLSTAALLLATHVAFAASYVPITNSITSSTTWGPTGTVVGSTFWVQNSITINSGVTLTIQPGVVVKFSSGAYLYCVGGLQAVGTQANPIYLTSIKDDNNPAGDTNGDSNGSTPNANDWQGVIFPSSAVSYASLLDWCIVRYAGAGNQGALLFQSVSDSVNNCTISKSYFGVDCQGSAAPVLYNTTIQASTQTPVVLDFTANPNFTSLVFSHADNGYDAIGIRGGTLTSGSYNLVQRGATVGVNPISNVTYVLLSYLTINPGVNVTIQHGIVIKPLGGGIDVYGNLTMNGTSSVGDSITITSINDDNFGQPGDTNNNGSITAPARGDWQYVNFHPGSGGSVSFCRLKFGTTNAGAGLVTMTNDNIGVSSSLLSDAAHGLAVLGTSNPAITSVQINNMSSTPVLQSVSANPTYTSVGLLANSITAIGINAEQIAVNSHLSARTLGGFTNITYYLMNGTLEMLTGATLTIDPGLVIKNQQGGGGLTIDGGLVANASAGQPIVFTSERDDIYGNPADTNGDGATTTPGSGDWTWIHFTTTATPANCMLNWCRITYGSRGGGNGYSPCVWATNTSPSITNCTIFKGYYGILVEGASAPTISTNTFDNLGAAPIVMSVQSNPTITTDNVFAATLGYNAIALISETMSQNALLRYRPGVGNAASPNFCYLPTGTITIPPGVTLSVAPDVVLKPSSSFTLFQVNGALNMVGADNTTNRIFITSQYDDATAGDATPTNPQSPGVGNWGNIAFGPTATSAACVIRNVKCQFGGSGGNSNGVFTTTGCSPQISNVEFFANATAFTFYTTSAPVLDSLNIFNCTQIAICASLVSAPVYGTHISFANDAYLGLGILGETIAQNVTTAPAKIGIYNNLNYLLAGTVTIAFGARWTIRPGVVIKAARAYSGDPGGNLIEVAGALVASGTTDSLIVFTDFADDAFGQDVAGDGSASQPSPGQWLGIQFDATSNDTVTVINNCRFRWAGYSYGTLYFLSASPTITNTQISRSYNPGAYIVGASAPVFTNVDFDSTASAPPVQMSLVSNPVFNNCRFQGNYLTALGVVPETIAQDVLWSIRPVAGRLNMPYYLGGQLQVGLGATLTFQPGVIVKMYGGTIDIQRAVSAVGRSVPESTIVFTSWRDDFYGGDSNGDSSYTSPSYGDWTSVNIEGTAIDANCVFRNCVFRYGNGNSTQGALRCINSSPAVDSCLFAYNGCGISVEGASDPGQFSTPAVGIHGNSFYSNTYYAINNTGNSFCVAAGGNWWGAASGPNDASATADLCSLGANAGTGDVVSNNINYTGWTTTGAVTPVLGDVSLNGFVMAYDASLVLQSVALLRTLSPTQALVADVSGSSGVTAFDASLILQYVAGMIRAFPAVSNGATRVPPDVFAAREVVRRARGTFTPALGTPRRAGNEWLVPVTLAGDAPAWSLELRLEQGDAATLASVDAAGGTGTLVADGADAGAARVALAATAPLAPGEVATLHFPAGAGALAAPRIAWARVNENIVAGDSNPAGPALPALSFLGRPAPDPARGPVAMTFAVAGAEAGAHANVRVVDVAGRTVRTLVDGPLAAGVHALAWNLVADDGRPAPAGVYFVRARLGAAAFTQRVVVVR